MIFTVLLLAQAVAPAQVANVERSAPETRAAFNETLLDYPSARFRDVYVTINPVAEAERGEPGSGYLCGYVNSKNAMGGYVGWKRFMALGDMVTLEGDDIGNMVIGSACGPRSVNDGIDRSGWVRPR